MRKKSTSVPFALDNTAETASSLTSPQLSYQELRERLLQSAPKKMAKRSCSPELAKQKQIEAMQKKRITRKQSIAACEFYRRMFGK